MLSLNNITSSKLSARPDGLRLSLIGADRQAEFTSSVYSVYSEVFGARHGWESKKEDYEEMLRDDRNFSPDSAFLAIETIEEEIMATVRLTRWKPGMTLPIEYEFGENVQDLVNSLSPTPSEVWHAGRLSIDKQKLSARGFPKSHSYRLLRDITAYCVQLVQPDQTVILISEADELAAKIYRKMGVRLEAIADSVDYLGSTTVPVLMRTEDLKQSNWMNQNDLQPAFS